MIPGINLLNIALGVIQAQSGHWVRFLGNTINDRGQDIPSYADPVEIVGSFQPVDARIIKELGLSTEKQYRNLYTSNPIAGLKRGTSPDLAIFYGRKYQTVGETDWFQQDGRVAVLLVDVGAAE